MFRFIGKTFGVKAALAAILAAGLPAAFLPTIASAAELVAVRFGVSSPTQTRIVLDMTATPVYELAATGDGRLDVRLVNFRPGASLASAGRGAGHAAGYEAGPAQGDLLVSINLKSPTKIKAIDTIPATTSNKSHRLVIDLVTAKPGALLASLPTRKFETLTEVIADVAPPPTISQSATVATEPEKVSATINTPAPPTLATARIFPTIVIDAGHGGGDPGAAGQNGTKESVVTLAAAEALAEILTATGRYKVILTRSTDTRLAHEERSRLARDAKADLFISLHADAHADASVRGGSVYTLSDEGTVRSAREALAKGNYHVFDLDVGAERPEVGGMLYDIAQRRTENESDRFAEQLIGRLAGVTPLLNNTHRRGNFKVLLAPDVPAVLLELAFISNKYDEANLGSLAWRKRTMGAAAGAIDTYFQQRAKALHANNTPSP